MSWLDIKKKARDTVHSTMALPAQLRTQAGAVIDGSARLHYKTRTFGDLDREGFATVVEAVDYIIIDTRIFVGADEDDRVYFSDINRTFKLSICENDVEDGIYKKWTVTEVSSP